MRCDMRQSMTEGNVRKLIIKLTGPMVLGMLGLIIFNLVDTYFVSKLGTTQLIALSFTFPVVLVINSIALGIGQGTAAMVSRAAGAKNKEKLVQYATESLTLGVVVVVIFVLVGLFTIDPLFKSLGATSEVMPYIKEYMEIWYLGMVFVVIPMVGNNSIRALGDTKIPSLVMLIAAVANSILDPIFIFGFGPVPGMGVRGAAIATVISRMTTFSVALYILVYREKIVAIRRTSWKQRWSAWKDIMYIGVPNTTTKIIQPLGISIITRLLSTEGLYTVAAYGVASKVERFALILVMSIAVVMTPFTGQNFGAGHMDRVQEGVKASFIFVLTSSIIVWLFLFVFGRSIGEIYTSDPDVLNTIIYYLQTVPIFYGAFGIIQISVSVLNGMNMPFKGAMLSISQMFLIYIPLAFIVRPWYGYKGIFGALSFSYLAISLLSVTILKNTIISPSKRL